MSVSTRLKMWVMTKTVKGVNRLEKLPWLVHVLHLVKAAEELCKFGIYEHLRLHVLLTDTNRR